MQFFQNKVIIFKNNNRWLWPSIFCLMSYSVTAIHLITFHCSNVEKSHLKITLKMNKVYLRYSDLWPFTKGLTLPQYTGASANLLAIGFLHHHQPHNKEDNTSNWLQRSAFSLIMCGWYLFVCSISSASCERHTKS